MAPPIAVVRPRLDDPRLKLSVVILSLQVLGQTVLGFKLSIAQILVPVAICGTIELIATLVRRRQLEWPASGILTGSSVAFILRASGTQHGDWWTLHGIHLFILAAVVSMVAKYAIRPGGRQLFNPSNIGLVLTLIVAGPTRVFVQYLWWGPLGPRVLLAIGVIVVGGAWVLRSTRMTGMALGFLLPFWAAVAAVALSGQSFFARWHDGAVGGAAYWVNICLSPELLVFVCFMMSDPRTAPRLPAARVLYGCVTALAAAGLLAPQRSEFGVKLAILGSLTIACVLSPVFDSVVAGGWRVPHRFGGRRMTLAAGAAAAVGLVVAVSVPVHTVSVADDPLAIAVEKGTAPGPPQ